MVTGREGVRVYRRMGLKRSARASSDYIDTKIL